MLLDGRNHKCDKRAEVQLNFEATNQNVIVDQFVLVYKRRFYGFGLLISFNNLTFTTPVYACTKIKTRGREFSLIHTARFQ